MRTAIKSIKFNNKSMTLFIPKIFGFINGLIKKKKIFIEPNHLFEVKIFNSHQSTFLIKYSQKGQRLIEEALLGCWKKNIQIPQSEILKFQIFVTNPTENKKLKCNIEVNEFSDTKDIINTTKFSFFVGTTLDTWQWKSFEVKSILN